jgi:iron complex transport system permease protein
MTVLKRKRVVMLAVMLVALLVVALLRMLVDRPPGGALTLAWPAESYARFRLNALLVSGAVGASLSIAGVLLQALLRNPLASPFVLGVSSGAGLGVTLSMYLGGTLGITLLEGDSNVVAALLGALLVLVIVHWLGRRHGVLDPLSLLLVGVIVAAMCGAIVMFLQRLVAGGLRGEMMLWMMGRIPQAVSNELLFTIGAITIAGLIVSTMMGRAMDVASLGEDEAQSVGLSLGRTRLGLFGIAGALTAGAVAVAGPIGFVGLIGPHLARLLIGARHGWLVPASAMCGAMIVIAADAASQAIDVGAGRLPVGVFTALLGGPAFIWLLRRTGGQPR